MNTPQARPRAAAEATPGALVNDSTACAPMRREHAQGVALAAINNGAVAHVVLHGIRNRMANGMINQCSERRPTRL